MLTQNKGKTMSYSRWSDSQWYTFWCVADEGVVENRENAILEVMLCGRFTAAEIRNDIESCVQKAVLADEKRGNSPDKADVKELLNIMREFVADVDARYPAELTIG
jgi:hypothetical protein